MVTLKVKDTTYDLRLTTRSLVNIENRLGKNPLNVFMGINETNLPKIQDLLIFLYEAILSFNRGIKFDNVYDIYDDWIAEGHTLIDLVALLVELLQESGFVPKEEVNEKN